MASEENCGKGLLSGTVLRNMLESVNDAVVTIDEDHKVRFMNGAAEKMFGYDRNEILGRDLSPLIPQVYRNAHKGFVEAYLKMGRPKVLGQVREFYVQHKDGHSFPVEISYSESEMEGSFYFTAIIRDITQRRELEREIRFIERLADVGKAVAQVVHEIRKPLMLIGGFARQLRDYDDLKNEEKRNQKLTIIVEEIRRLEKLLNGLRILTKPPESSRKRSVELNRLLKETFDLLDPLIQQNQQVFFEWSLCESSVEIKGDPDQLKQVFLNILQNALEAIEEKGIIRVTSRVVGAGVQIAIEDNGPGIPPEIQEKLFDPFFTTKSTGTGLGLAVSQNIIQDHGGQLKLYSSPATGTTFVIELPVGS